MPTREIAVTAVTHETSAWWYLITKLLDFWLGKRFAIHQLLDLPIEGTVIEHLARQTLTTRVDLVNLHSHDT